MINFKEHDGMLFKMLEEPTPLTPDADMPCLIRLIQDDSPMGRYVKQCWGHDKLFMREHTIYGINADMAANVGVAKDTPISIHMFEIIGTFVKEGSAEWAFGWQICEKPKEEPELPKEPIANCENCKHVCTNSNIDHCHMYEPKPKPLLAEAKVGDLC